MSTPSLSRQVTIGTLSDKVLLNIFSHFLDDSPRHWPRLVHICRRWRGIVFASHRALHLRLFCIPGTPVSKTLDCWPTLPIVVQYGGYLALDPPAPQDEGNVIAALKQSDRVSSISLTVTSSLLEKLSVIEEPFLELETLVLLSRDIVPLTLPSAFRWGSRLRCLRLTRIFPSLLQLYSSENLVDLQLYEVLDPQYFFQVTDALSAMTRLQSLSLHFLFAPDRALLPHVPSEKRVVLPALIRLNFRGVTKYLEDLVARIDAPHLGDIEIEVKFLKESIFDLSKLSEFIDRIKMHKSHRRAHILLSERAFYISLIRPGTPTCIKLRVICNRFSEQLYTMARIYIGLSTVLLNVEDLRISATRRSSWEDVTGHQWLMLINPFTGVKWFHIAENLSTDIVHALHLPDNSVTPALPALHKLYIPQPGARHAPLSEAVVSFMTSRWLSGHHVVVDYERPRRISELGAMYDQCWRHYSLTRSNRTSFSTGDD